MVENRAPQTPGQPRELPPSCQPPDHALWGPAFKFLCIIAVSKGNLEHWKDTQEEGWKNRWEEHSRAVVSRFHNSNLTAGLMLTTTAMFLTSHPPLTHWMDYDSPASYSFALAAFGAALLSVISGVAALVMYETGAAHHHMQVLIKLRRWHVILLLSVLAWPSICLAAAAIFMYISILIACFSTGNIIIQVIMALSFSAFWINGVCMLYVLIYVGKKFAESTSKEVLPSV